jgi:hypothetical protein
MSDDQNAPKTTNRPSKRRGVKPGLVAAAIAGALLVPAAAVTIAAEPWNQATAAVPAGAYGKGHENGKGKQTAEEAEAELRECLKGTDLSEAKNLDIATLMKAVRCLELVDSVNDPNSPLTEKEVQQLVKQGLQAVETAGVDRVQIPGVLRVLSDSGLVKPLAGNSAADLITVMAESKVIEDYANGEIQRNEAAKQIAEVVVATAEKQAAEKQKASK